MSDTMTPEQSPEALQPTQAAVPAEYEALKPANLDQIDHSRPEDRFLDPTGVQKEMMAASGPAHDIGQTAMDGTIETNAPRRTYQSVPTTTTPLPPKHDVTLPPEPPTGY